MSWNHRVVREKVEFEHEPEPTYIYRIHEVYYNEAGDIDGFTDQHIDLSNYSVSSLKEDLVMLQKAFNYPILERIDTNTLAEVN
jgi:hypothetical protein